MTGTVFEFDALLYLWDARRTDSWVFLSVPEDLADEILEIGEHAARGFGSLRVDVTVGATSWRTSLFPSRTTFVLPIKKAVRRTEGLEAGDTVRVQVALVDVSPLP